MPDAVNPALDPGTSATFSAISRQSRGALKGGVKKGAARAAPKRKTKKAAPKPAHAEAAPLPEEKIIPDAAPEAATAFVQTDRYFEDVGRRKTATARVRMFTKSGNFTVNGKPYGVYFPTLDLQKTVEDPLKEMKLWERFRVSAIVSGGGTHAQAEAVRHGLARCLIRFNHDFRKRLKRVGFLTRDPRMKERKKFGLKKARRAPQWQKR